MLISFVFLFWEANMLLFVCLLILPLVSEDTFVVPLTYVVQLFNDFLYIFSNGMHLEGMLPA